MTGPLMEGRELEGNLRNFSQLSMWIIEHVWAHKVMDIQEVVDSSFWPDVDLHPLSLEDPLGLRVWSARAFSVVKRRDPDRFESVIRFLDATHRLVPDLVPAIQHMKIVFGLKTLVVMSMLRGRCGSIDTSLKILDFFPRDLPQYRGQCSPREMFLMRKNHLDFRVLAQILTTDSDKCEYYVKHQMDDHYGDAYIQKLEDRLLQYLQLLEQVLPRDTRVDQVRRRSPDSDEERLLLRVISSDSVTIATTLRRLLRCDAASIPARPPPAEPGPVHQNPTVRDSEKSRDDEENCLCCHQNISSSSSFSPSSPQFCSRHRRWVWSILSECPAESSDPVLQPISPPLFQSSPSSSSSQDITPSGLVLAHRPELFSPERSFLLGCSSPSPRDPGPAQPRKPESEPSSHPSPTGSAPSSSTDPSLQSIPPLEPLSEDSVECPHDSGPSTWTGPSAPVLGVGLDLSSDSAAQVQLRLSLQTQQVLLCSKLLQPRVSVCRLKVQNGRVRLAGPGGPGGPGTCDETRTDSDSSFDINSLFTQSCNSFSDSADSDYQPSRKRTRVF